jgi:hypothetical protein
MLKERGSLIAVILLLAVFAFGAEQLLELRYAEGDVYPAYSSLRADPLGAKGFYEGLDGIRGLNLSRIMNVTDKLGPGKGAEVICLGVSEEQLRELTLDDAQDLQRFLGEGGRAVFALYPEGRGAERDYSSERMTRKHATNDLDAELRPISMEDRFGFKFDAAPLLDDDGRTRTEQVTLMETNLGLPKRVSWHSAIYFDKLDKAWTTIYAREERAVLIERRVGAGSLVLASDSYFASNEALRKERHAELLAWLAGGQRNIEFDETHLGVGKQPGLAELARKYHLTGLAAGLALVAALFVWSNTAMFLPPRSDDDDGGWVEGRDSATGLVNLLRRSVAPSEILATCLAEWKRTGAAPEKVQAVEGIFAADKARPARERSPVATYHAIQQFLTKKV